MNVRVLLISHSCQVRSQGQPRAEHLAAMPGIDLRVLVPDRWYEYGQLRHPRMPEPCPFDYEVGKVRWPWAGKKIHSYLHYYPRLARTLLDFRPHVIDVWEEPWALVSA
ncbi:MAG: hypothetical protein ACREIT_05050, partial [Tepidisphaeraceae bacterium]